MDSGRQRSRVEMIFIIAMVVLCGGLTVLQYHWTGELARAEMDRMSGSLANQAKLMTRAFDTELAQACGTIVPTSAELDRGTAEAVHLGKLREWKSAKPRPIFKRVAVAVPSGEKVELFEVGISSETYSPMEWPEEWVDLQQNLSKKIAGGSPPFEGRTGFFREFPVMGSRFSGRSRGPGGPRGRQGESDFGGPRFGPDRGPGGPGGPGGGGGEREWVIVELDAGYLRDVWLPELIATHLNPEGNAICDVTVRSKATGEIIFSTLADESKGSARTQSVDFNFQGSRVDQPGPPTKPSWTMEIGRREGSLEAAVSGSRKKNLAVAVVLNALILAAGWMLLRVTRHSRELAEERMKFVANVTHELRTPLTVIRGAAHNMKRGIVKDQEGIARYSGLILEHAESLGEMVEQVLDFSGGQKARDQVPVELDKVIRDAVLTVKGDAKFSSCEIDLKLPSALPTVTGDPASLRRALQNLIENAAKHGGVGGWIGVSASALAGRVEIQVADRGPGIPADEQREIFNPFYRGSIAREKQVRGSGLGLSLVKEIVTAHGGNIFVRSETGRGSTFTVNLPANP
ncbi:MAG: HAMP domain-containing sensor histidine kinase [Luteolibacter sp.]|uniref:sensor histidine kinase n=1 Tax=Luteolibacter sp. TaxID=1962973 RepID=UPI003264A0CC